MSATIVTEPSAQISKGNSVSWGAVSSGVVISLVAAALFNMLGIGLGFVNLQMDTDVAKSIGVMAIIWILLSGIISMLIGGWFTGRFSTQNHALQALVAWSVAVIINFTMAFSALGTFMSGVGGLLQRIGSIHVPERVKESLENHSIPERAKESLKKQASQQMQTMQKGKDDADQQTSNGKDKDTNQQTSNEEDRDAKAKQTDIEQQASKMRERAAEKARQMDMEQQTSKMQEAAGKAAEKASDVIGSMAIIIALGFLLSGVAAYIGGRLGAKRDLFKRV